MVVELFRWYFSNCKLPSGYVSSSVGLKTFSSDPCSNMFWPSEFIGILLLNVIQTCHWITHFVVTEGLVCFK